MAEGDICLDADGNILVDQDGNILTDGGSGCCGCCQFRQAINCDDDEPLGFGAPAGSVTAGEVFSDEDAEPDPIPCFYWSDEITNESPETILTAEQIAALDPFDSCELCNAEEPVPCACSPEQAAGLADTYIVTVTVSGWNDCNRSVSEGGCDACVDGDGGDGLGCCPWSYTQHIVVTRVAPGACEWTGTAASVCWPGAPCGGESYQATLYVDCSDSDGWSLDLNPDTYPFGTKRKLSGGTPVGSWGTYGVNTCLAHAGTFAYSVS